MGIRVTDQKEIEHAFKVAKETKDTPVLIEFMIEREANVLPMVPGGNPLDEMIME